MTAVIAGLAAAGLAIASYFTAVAYRWTAPDARWIPSVCRMGPETCAAVVFAPSARVLGLPNSVLGQAYYAALLGGAALDALDAPGVWPLLAAASLATVALGLYLSRVLLRVLRAPCPLCFAAHGLNAVICVLLLLLPRTSG